MNSLLPRFFTRLYGSIFIAICGSVLLTHFAMSSFVEQDRINDFTRDMTYVQQQLEIVRKKHHESPQIFYPQLEKDLYQFEMNWWDPLKKAEPCNNCEYLGIINRIPVYHLANDTLMSVHSVANTSAKITLQYKYRDTDISERSDDFKDSDIDITELVPIIVFIVVLLAIAVALYWSIIKLERRILHLNTVSQKFGKGELQARADTNMPEPLNDLAISFNNMAQSLAETVSENQIFAQAVPHELRTPLSRIQLAAGILRKDCQKPEQLALLDNIDDYIDDINELSAQVITFSKVNYEPGPGKTESVNLSTFLERRIARLKPKSQVKIVLDTDNDIRLYCDPAYLRLLFDNLLKNAVNHATKNVMVSAAVVNGNITLAIEDDGSGIHADDLNKIFMPYSRLDQSRSRKTGGLGMGLAIAKSAAKRLNGEIHVSTASLGGAKFSVTIIDGNEQLQS